MQLMALVLAAAIQPLWPEAKVPDAQPHQVAAPSQEVARPGFNADEHRMPYLEWSEPPAADKKTQACVILISGGGYSCTCDGPAFRPLEKKLLENGITCVWLWYRTPRPKGLPIYQWGWEDGQRAVRLVRKAAAERGYDPEKIGVLGCSAGSHLSLLLALNSQTPAYRKVDEIDDIPCHVNFAIPMCPAYVLTDGLTGANGTKGESPDAVVDQLFKFDDKTCPVCFFHGGKDPYSPNGSTKLYRKLREKKIPSELHLDPDRGHGPVDARKFERAIEFMRQLGFLGKLRDEVDLKSRYATDDARIGFTKVAVWPEGKMPDVQTNQCTPYLEWHMPKNLKTKAIQIVYSGGAYQGNNPDGFEAAPMRRYLNEKGMAVVTMKYRTPRPAGLAKHITAWQDLQRAVRLVRAEAPKRGLDPDRIGIMGSSAGGHLTLMGVTSSLTPAYEPIDELDKIPCNVQWACAIYPAYGLTDGIDGGNKTGGNADSAVLVPEFAFDEKTCPVFFIHGDADGYAAMCSVKCWEKQRQMGIQSELHTLATRKHCFYMKASPGTLSYTWFDVFWDFLTKKGFNK